MRNWKHVLSVVALATLVSPLAMASPASGPVRLHAGSKMTVHAKGRKAGGMSEGKTSRKLSRTTGKRVRKAKSGARRLAKAPKHTKKTKGRVRRVKTARRARQPRRETAPQTPAQARELSRS